MKIGRSVLLVYFFPPEHLCQRSCAHLQLLGMPMDFQQKQSRRMGSSEFSSHPRRAPACILFFLFCSLFLPLAIQLLPSKFVIALCRTKKKKKKGRRQDKGEEERIARCGRGLRRGIRSTSLDPPSCPSPLSTSPLQEVLQDVQRSLP